MGEDEYDYVYELGVLRRIWPDGIPQQDYKLLLAALHKEMSFRAIGALIAKFTGQHPVDVYFQAMGAGSLSNRGDRLSQADVDRVWVRLLDNGWVLEFPLPRYLEPGFAEEAVAALHRAYPEGLADDECLPLLRALVRDVHDIDPITYIVTEAFPARDPTTVWIETQKAHDQAKAGEQPPAAAELAWQRLVAHGFPPSGGPAPPGT